jgi:hypothetical protein
MAKGKTPKNNNLKSKQKQAAPKPPAQATNAPPPIVDDKAAKNSEKMAQSLLEARKEAKDLFEDMSDIDESVKSIGQGIDKNNKGYKTFSKFAESIKASSQSIATTLGKQNDLTINEVKYIKKVNSAKNKFFSEEKRLGKLLKNKVINEQQYNKYSEAAAKNYAKTVDGFEATSESGKQIQKSLEATADGAMDFTKNIQKADGFMESFLSNMEGSVPLASEIGSVFKSLGNGGAGIKAAIGALAGAATYLAYKQGMMGDYFGKVASFNMKDQIVENEIALKKAQNSASFAIQEAGVQFGAQMATAASDFKQEMRNAFFGEALTQLGTKAAAMLAKAGFSAKDIAEGSLSVAGNLGAGADSSQRLGKEVAVFSKYMGIGADQATDLAANFRIVDNSNAESALNMLEGTRQMAVMMGLNPGDVMRDMADSTKEIAQYNFRSGKELQKQVIAVKAMGGNFNKIATAGRNMVLNYKDSIKAEMELSAMLGKSINLSEVRAKFASSDIPGAVKALQDELGGMDLSSLDFFSKDAISNALGGMDFEEIAKAGKGQYGEIAKNTKDLDAGIDKSSRAVVKASLEQTNNQRLNIEYSIAETKTMNAAAIQAQASIAQQQIQNQKSLNDVMIDNDYLQLKANLAFLRTLGTELPGMLLSGLVGGLASFLPQILSGAWKMISGGGTAGAGGMTAASAGTWAAGAAGFWSLGKGMYNVGSNEAQRGGKGGGWQTTGNVIAGIGAEFVNLLDYIPGSPMSKLGELTGTTFAEGALSISELEKFRASYRSKEGEQIGIGRESNQKLANWIASNMDYLSRGGLEDEVKNFQKAVKSGLIKTNVSIAEQVTANSAQTTQAIANTSMSSLDDIERQATEAMNKSKTANNKIMGDTGKSITDMTKTALTSVTTAANTTGTASSSTPTPVARAAKINSAPVFDVNAETTANTAMQIFALLQTWAAASTGGTQVYLDSRKINSDLRDSVRARRAIFVLD